MFASAAGDLFLTNGQLSSIWRKPFVTDDRASRSRPLPSIKNLFPHEFSFCLWIPGSNIKY
jgi:hypothetical protein